MSKIFEKPKYYRGKRVAITEESIGSSQLLGARARAAPKVYACARYTSFSVMFCTGF